MSFRNFLLISTLLAGAVGVAFAQSGPNIPAQPVTRTYVFPPVTLTTTETARVVVVNTAPAATGNNPAPSCTGTITFMASGATPPTVSAVTFTLGAGQFAFADLPYGKSGISTPPGEVVGQIASTFTPTSSAPCNLGMSLVVFDSTSGVAHIVLGNASAEAVAVPLPFLTLR